MPNYLKELTEKIQEVCPDLRDSGNCPRCWGDNLDLKCYCPDSEWKEIRLEHVLRTLTLLKVPDVEMSVCGAPQMAGLLIEAKKYKALWELNKSFQDQTPETIKFLHSLICSKKQ